MRVRLPDLRGGARNLSRLGRSRPERVDDAGAGDVRALRRCHRGRVGVLRCGRGPRLMRGFLRDNSLSLFFGALFLVTIVGQSFVGQRAVNAERAEHGERPLVLGRLPRLARTSQGRCSRTGSRSSCSSRCSSSRRSGSSSGVERVEAAGGCGLDSDAAQRVGAHAPADAPRWARVGGLRRGLYENSLLLVMGAIFFASWAGQSLGNWRSYNEDRASHDSRRSAGSRTCASPSSGRRPSRTGSPSFSPSGRWPSSRSTSASVAPPSRSRSAPPTTRRPAEPSRAQPNAGRISRS